MRFGREIRLLRNTVRGSFTESGSAFARFVRSQVQATASRRQKWVDLLRNHFEAALPAWIVCLACAAALKVWSAPTRPDTVVLALAMAFPFVALAAAPVLGFRAANAWFSRAERMTQPEVRLARYGSWRKADSWELTKGRVRGPSLFVLSLTIGILLNVPVRALEFLTIVPAISPGDPAWAQMLVHAFTLDAVILNFAYMACFVAALRGAPLFPRLLLATWLLDLAMQIMIATYVGSANDLPLEVSGPLRDILLGNVKKVGVSMALWLPFLAISPNINLLFRHRVRVS